MKFHIMGGEQKSRELVELFPDLVRRDPDTLLGCIRAGLGIKMAFMEGDEFDKGRRNLLNYGHCFGHALEATSHFEIPHGQAVVLGMMMANVVARRRGVLSDEAERFVLEGLLMPALYARPKPEHLDAELLLEAMSHDKKQTGEGLVLIMLSDGYEVVKVDDCTAAELTDAVAEMGWLCDA